MFIGRKSVRDLRIWLEGYSFARGQAGLPLLPDEGEFDGFDDFVCKKYGWQDVGGWAAKIAYYYRDDGHALDEFFKLLDEYRAAKQRKSRRAKAAGKRKQAEPGTSSAGKT